MLSPTCRQWPIRTLVNRWGLDDLASFERAFVRQFGCAPSLYRERFAR
jgi:AraC-like DNA-binding protein